MFPIIPSFTVLHKRALVAENEFNSSGPPPPKKFRFTSDCDNLVTPPIIPPQAECMDVMQDHRKSVTGDYSKMPFEKTKFCHHNTLEVRRLSPSENFPTQTLDFTPENSPVRPLLATTPEESGDAAFFTAMSTVWDKLNKEYPPEFQTKLLNLSTLRNKVEQAMCSDPWQFIFEIFETFGSVKKRLKKGSMAHQTCVKITEIIQSHFTRVIQELNYCCSSTDAMFNPKALVCKNSCFVKVEENYYYYEDQDQCAVVYCVKCYKKLPDMVQVEQAQDNITITNSVSKSEFSLWKNDMFTPEPVVKCVKCGKSHHQICVRHMDKFSHQFVCASCSTVKPKIEYVPPQAKDLPETKLSSAIENRVNSYLENLKVQTTVTIRVVAAVKKLCKVKPEMAERCQEMPPNLPYTAKSIYAFFQNDGEEICFFGLDVQEYGPDCPEPNKGRVYLAYLDSVSFFEPKDEKKPVYQEIVLGYLDYARNLGYDFVHLWACPPSRVSSDYLFHAHPPEQKLPDLKRLQVWYHRLADKGKKYGIMEEFKNYTEYAQEANITSASQLPYFDGDNWPILVEHAILEVKEAIDRPVKKLKSRNNGQKKPVLTLSGDPVWDILRVAITRKENVFFVARLNSKNLLTLDPDCMIECNLMENETGFGFVDWCRENQFEFSSARRAQYSTLVMVSEISSQLKVYCAKCSTQILTPVERFNLNVCFDCVDKELPVMSPDNSSVDDDIVDEEVYEQSVQSSNKKNNLPALAQPPPTALERRKTYLFALIHSACCGDSDCQVAECTKIKLNRKHNAQCYSLECKLCENYFKLIRLHVKTCDENACPVEHCYAVKNSPDW